MTRVLSATQHRSLFQVCVLLLVACSDPSGSRITPGRNPKLLKAFYWGLDGHAREVPNTECCVANPVRHPAWVSESVVWVATEYFSDATRTTVRGLFEITLDATSLQYVSFREFGLPGQILGLRAGLSQETIYALIADSVGTQVFAVETATGRPRVVVDARWSVSAFTTWPGRGGVIAVTPRGRTTAAGLVWFDDTASRPESLLSTLDVQVESVNDVAVSGDGRHLFLVSDTMSRPVSQRFLVYDLEDMSLPPQLLAERRGVDGAVVPNPATPNLVLVQYYEPGDAFTVPGSHVELVHLDGVSSSNLDMRLDPALFPYSERPCWDRAGQHFAFSSNSFSGEGDRGTLSLWIYRDVP